MAAASDKDDIKQLWDIGLTDKEVYSIGCIVAYWGSLEQEIFLQTLHTYHEAAVSKGDDLPKAMNNLNFSEVLELWKERVVDVTDGDRKNILTKQYERLVHCSEFRNALIHGMWDWDKNDPGTLITTRIKQKKILHTTFEPSALQDFSTTLGEINLLIRYPGGFAELMEKEGGFVNTAALRRIRLDRDK